VNDLRSTARPPSTAQLALVPEMFKEVLKKPLRLLPPAVRPAALEVWACHRHLKGLESPLPLAGMLWVWIERFDLRPGDATAVLQRMLHPEQVGQHKFASDLTSALAAEVANVLRRQKSEAAQAEAQAKAEAMAAEAMRLDHDDPDAPKSLFDFTAGIGRDPRS
jgi:hypothetical protein